MDRFPPLQNWFRFANSSELSGSVSVNTNGQYNFNNCVFFTLLWKDDADKEKFVRELAKLIARIRSNSSMQISWANSFCTFIDSGASLWTDINKEHFKTAVLSNGIRNASLGMNIDGLKGHIGEILYFLIQKQFSSFNRILSSPDSPKRRSTDPGNDIVELCLSNENIVYIVFSEIKTTDDTIGSLHKDIIDQFNNRIKVNYSDNLEEFQKLLEIKNDFILTTYSPDIKAQVEYFLLNEMDEICMMSIDSNPRKQVLGMINYGKAKIHGNMVFKDIDTKLDKTFSRDTEKKKVILVGIKDIPSIIDDVYNLLFNN